MLRYKEGYNGIQNNSTVQLTFRLCVVACNLHVSNIQELKLYVFGKKLKTFRIPSKV